MKDLAPWIVTALAIVLCFYVLTNERDALDSDNAEWITERDSLIRVATDAQRRAQDAEATMDSLRFHTDSIIGTFAPETVTVAASLRFMRFAPLCTVQDSLMGE